MFEIASQDIAKIVEKIRLTKRSIDLLQYKKIYVSNGRIWKKVKSKDKLSRWLFPAKEYVQVHASKVDWGSVCMESMTPEEALLSNPPCGVAGKDILVYKYSQDDPERRKNFFQPKFYTYFDDTAKYHSCLFEDG